MRRCGAMRVRVVKETVTDYLAKLEELATDTSNQKRFLQDSAQEMHFDYIEPLMPTWNPNLIFSPLEKDHQIFSTENGFSALELEYTGFTQEARHEELEHIFWEFGDPIDHVLERDYALFQETGEDEVFDYSKSHYRPTHLHFVQRGTDAYLNRFHDRTRAYAMSLLHLEKWGTETRVSKTSYMENWFDNFW